MSATSDMPGAWDPGSLSCPHLPLKPALPSALGVTHRSRFVVSATAEAATQARTVARSLLSLMLTATETSAVVSRKVQACLSELTAIAYTRAHGDHLLCELWCDTEHVFTAVQHNDPLPLLPDETTLGLNVVKSFADDYGAHLADGVWQMWAAIRIL